jgi:CRP-like cAMP-binding protein
MLENLGGIAFFDDFSSWQLELLSPLFEPYSCNDGTMIFQQGDEAVFLYLILEGVALLQYKPYDSELITLTHLKAGDALGWSAVIGRPTYSSSAVSVGELKALRIRGADLRALCHEHRTTGMTIMNRLAHGVSGRWKNAHMQVRAMLRECIENSVNSQHERN